MAHITSTELGQLSALPDDVIAEIAGPTVTEALEAATSTVNGYLAPRGYTPLTVVPRDVKQATADIAAYRLASRRGYSPRGANTDLRQRFDDAMAWLRDVADGAVSLDTTVVQPSPTVTARVITAEPRGW